MASDINQPTDEFEVKFPTKWQIFWYALIGCTIACILSFLIISGIVYAWGDCI